LFQEFKGNSRRLEGYDYSQPGYYFVTICTKEYSTIFGQVIDNEVKLSKLGKIAEECWLEIPQHFSDVELDEYVVMPNHLHGIIKITGQLTKAQLNENKTREFAHRKSETLSTVIGTYKAAVTRKINNLQNTCGSSIWQPNYSDRIIRQGQELFVIRRYINQNPVDWERETNKSINLANGDYTNGNRCGK